MKMGSLIATTAMLAAAAQTQAATINFNGGNLATAANWAGGSKPASGDIGLIEVDGTLSIGNTLGGWIGSGVDLVIQGGATVTSGNGLPLSGSNNSGDYGHTAGGVTSTFNDATLLAEDDIFANNSVMTFNVGSVAMSGDDFEANGTSTININGGTHTAGDVFGAQSAGAAQFGTVNIAGGSVTAGQFRVESDGTLDGVLNLLAGDGTLTGGGDASLITGIVTVSSAWSGSWTITGLSGTDWESAVTGGQWTLDGTEIDSVVFANNFEITNSGQTLSIVPEPSSLALLGLGGLLVARRRRG